MRMGFEAFSKEVENISFSELEQTVSNVKQRAQGLLTNVSDK
jgi:hypothetical protein